MARKVFGETGLRALLAGLKTQLDHKADLSNGQIPKAQLPDVQWDDVSGRPGTDEVVPGFSLSAPPDLTQVPKVEAPDLGITAYYVSDLVMSPQYKDYFELTTDFYLEHDGSSIMPYIFTRENYEVEDFGDAWAFAFMICALKDGVTFVPANGVTVILPTAGIYFLDMPVNPGVRGRVTQFVVKGGRYSHQLSYQDLTNTPVGRVRTADAYQIAMASDPSDLPQTTGTIDNVEYTMYRVSDILTLHALEDCVITHGAFYGGELIILGTRDESPEVAYTADGMGAYISTKVYNVLMDGLVIDGISFPSAGLYFAAHEDTVEYEGETYECQVCAATVSREAQFENKILDVQYLPEIPLTKVPLSSIRYSDLSIEGAPCYRVDLRDVVTVEPTGDYTVIAANGVIDMVSDYDGYNMKFKATRVTLPHTALDTLSISVVSVLNGVTDDTVDVSEAYWVFSKGVWYLYHNSLKTLLACVLDTYEGYTWYRDLNNNICHVRLNNIGTLYLIETYLDDDNRITVNSIDTNTGVYYQPLATPYIPQIDFETGLTNVPAYVQPLIVNLEPNNDDPNAPYILGDKKYGEIMSARRAGRNVLMNMGSQGDGTSALVLDCTQTGSTVKIYFLFNGNIVNVTGSANDYIRLNLT